MSVVSLESIDWIIIGAFFVVSLLIGVLVARKSGKNAAEFFLSGRNMPWWLLGVSMVATTFSADTPNLVTDIVRKNGVAGNWVWWAFLLTGMLTVFVYARLWRRSGVTTDLEFYELRYAGKEAAFLRGFRAVYLGVLFNIGIMATVCLAATKIGQVLLGLEPMQTLLIASIVTVFYSAIGGLKGVIITDFVQFILAMIGSVGAAYVVLDVPAVGGLANLVSHENVVGKLDFIPDFNNTEMLVSVFIIPLAVQWWSSWYPGAEPGGGGYIAQRMLSAKNEGHAVGATLFFNIAHYALRPWPWIIIALASLIVFPTLADIQAAFPHVDPANLGHDHAYPAMLTYLPAGLLGLVVASLIAAFMSTISTHLNWGASYVVNDVYLRFLNPAASDRQQVWVGRITTVVLMVVAAVFSTFIESAKAGFDLLLQIGAGTGLIFILRWFWWRINAYTEIAGMVISFVVALVFFFAFPDLASHWKLILGVLITTIGWLIVTFITPPTDTETLRNYYKLIRPFGRKWKEIAPGELPPTGSLASQIVAMALGCLLVYAALFATGYLIYGNTTNAVILYGVTALASWALYRTLRK
ncbi:MAG: Na+:solute symporter [Flavobacteriales bacterium]|nr:Na+:solute symporter [Flavobacteriales bacterium]